MNNQLLVKASALALALAALAACGSPEGKVTPAIPADKAVEAKVEQVLKGMTLEEKAGQLVQINISALTEGDAIDPAKLDRVIGQYKVGSILNVMGERAHSREETAAMVR